MPPLDEETAMFMPITDPRISLTKATEIMRQQDRIIAADPAVEMVVGKIGRAETATDPAPINMAETMLIFKPKDQWPKGSTKDSIIQRLDAKLHIPGVTNIWTQPIRNRIDMLSTGNSHASRREGVRSRLKDDRKEVGRDRARAARVPGAVDLYAERITGAPYLEIKVDREAAARYGINVGRCAGCDRSGDRRQESHYHDRRAPALSSARSIRERFPRGRRSTEECSGGRHRPERRFRCRRSATFDMVMGPSMISSENGLLRGTVLMNVRGRDVGGFVDEASVQSRERQHAAGLLRAMERAVREPDSAQRSAWRW